MVFIKKVNNSDPGDADHWGGDDIDRLDDYFADVDITGPALINTETKIRKDKLKIGDTSNDHFVTISNSEQAANRTATIPILAGSDDFVFAAETQTLTNKTINASNNTISNIGTSAISNDAVTFAKMQNIATDRLLGRDTAASGDPEELTVSGGIEFTGSGGIQTSAFTGDVTKSAGGTATTIANDAVTNAKMANMAANTIKGNNTSGAADPSDISVGTNTVLGRVAGDIVAAQLATGQIADDAVTYAKIQDVSNTDRLLGRDTAAAGVVEELSVSGGIEFTGSGGIQTSAFTGDVTKSAGGTALTIANDAVTYAKMQNVVNDDRFLGRISGAGGDVEELTGTQATTLLDVFTDALKGLAPASGGGTTTYLRADGTWQTPPGGGGGDNITVNAVAVTDADFDDATPAAPAGGVNVKWQKDASSPANVSAHLAADDVSNTVLANMAANTIKGNNTGSSGDPADISVGANTVLGRKGGNIVAETIATDQIADDAVTYAKIQNMSTDRLLGRDTAASGNVEELTVGGGIEFTGTGIQTSAFTGDVTKSAGGTATTIANDAVSYAKMQNVVNNNRFLGRISGAGGDVEEVTGTQATTLLDTFTDALKGLAPASGGGTSNFLRADGSWAAPPGGSGDSISVNGTAATDADFDDATPAASADHVNVKWQKDAGTPNNISAQVQPASGAQGGIVTTGTQTLAGAKTFSGNVTTSADLTAAGATLRTGIISPTTTGKNNDWNPTNLATTYEIRWNGANYCGLTGLSGGASGREILLTNVTTDYLLWLENENTSSTAANRFSLPNSFPAFLLPGDSIELRYDGTASRWRVKAWINKGVAMGLNEFSDFLSGGCIAGSGVQYPGYYQPVLSGTSASVGTTSTTGLDSTEKAFGIQSMSTGTTSTGYAGIGHYASSSLIPTLSGGLYVVRAFIGTDASSAQDFGAAFGFHDGVWNGALPTDGVYWEYRRVSGSTVEWSQTRSAGGVHTRTNTGSPSTSTTEYIWFVLWVNPGWTRADYIYSTDSVNFTLASSPTTGFPSSSQLVGLGMTIYKSAGTTSRSMHADLMGWRCTELTRG